MVNKKYNLLGFTGDPEIDKENDGSYQRFLEEAFGKNRPEQKFLESEKGQPALQKMDDTLLTVKEDHMPS